MGRYVIRIVKQEKYAYSLYFPSTGNTLLKHVVVTGDEHIQRAVVAFQIFQRKHLLFPVGRIRL